MCDKQKSIILIKNFKNIKTLFTLQKRHELAM